MLTLLTGEKIPAFTTACTYEHVFGSKALTAMRAYGLCNADVGFFLQTLNDEPVAAIYLHRGVMVISARQDSNADEIAELVRREKVIEIDTNLEQCRQLQKILGGQVESSYFMVHQGAAAQESFDDIEQGELQKVFSVLQQSHEYYRTHLKFEPWSQDLQHKIELGLSELYQLRFEDEVIGTGCIISGDEECGVIAAVAVIPQYRNRGFGSHISRFLVQRIRGISKTPRLISGYDEVAELYRKIGFTPCGRWGELYL